MEISRETRSDTLNYLLCNDSPFYGNMNLLSFLKKIWDLSAMRSVDRRYANAEVDIRTHVMQSHDWSYADLLYDYFHILDSSDEIFCVFIETCLHPLVISDEEQVTNMLTEFNTALARDNCHIIASGQILGKSFYKIVRGMLLVTCYASEDKPLYEKLYKHLSSLRRQNYLRSWSAREILPGAEWKKEIDEQLNNADIILLLISSDFLASDNCYDEMKRALARHHSGQVSVLPILLRPCNWEKAPFNILQVLPGGAQAVTRWQNLDEAFSNIIQGIRQVIEKQQLDRLHENTISKVNNLPHAIAEMTILDTLGVHEGPVYCLAMSSDEQTLVSGGSDGTIKIWNLASGQITHTLGHTGPVHSVVIDPDSKTLISGNNDNTVRIWDLSTGNIVRTLPSFIRGLVISTDGKILVSGGSDGTIKVWDLSASKEKYIFRGHSRIVRCLAISTSGRILVSGSDDHTIRVWDLSTGEQTHVLTDHTNTVHCVAISTDEHILVSGSWDNRIKIWDLSSGKKVCTLKNDHRDHIYSVVISADRKILASGSRDKTINVWDLCTKKRISTLKDHVGAVYSLAISADGQTLVSGSWDRTIKVWGI